MINSNGKNYPTIVDAAKEFGVAPKTVRDWIEKGIIHRSTVKQFGIRRVQVFTPEYMKNAQKMLVAHMAKKDGIKRKNARLAA